MTTATRTRNDRAGSDLAPWWELDVEDVCARLHVSASEGLTSDEAARRTARWGRNVLVEPSRTPVWRTVLNQFTNTLILVLLVAAAVTTALGEVQDTAVIVVIVVLNAALGAVQEIRAERAVAELARMVDPSARVVRDGVEQRIAATELVPGDVIVLEAGDVVPADARLIEAPNLRTDEAALTGESVPVDKMTEPLPQGSGDITGDRHNMLLKGTALTYGRARAVVTATGMSTALGSIAGLLQTREAPPSPLHRRLAVLGRRLAFAALAVCALVFVAGIARGEPADVMFLTAVTLAVAAVPEALPAVVTVALALGARRMAARNAIIRRLPAVETLGSVTVICSDKTGTLTEGTMLAERVWTPVGELVATGEAYSPVGEVRLVDGPAGADRLAGLDDLLTAAVLCNDATLLQPTPSSSWNVAGDPTEGALLGLAAKAGVDPQAIRAALPRIAEVPFDSRRKRMTTLHRAPDGGVIVATKGAPETLLPLVAFLGSDRAAASADGLGEVSTQADRYASSGYRVLAIAGRSLPACPDDPEDAERDLVLYGLVAMADPPRSASADAVAACRQAGMISVMITGDHPATARAVADRLGILSGRRVLTGPELATMGADALAREVEDIAVYARTTPEQKLDIIDAWTTHGHVVAMTGDGVNDAPALRRSDIGVAMGRTGTEVARQAADMVLTDDDFATIVHAVHEGRRVYDNVRRFIRYTLTSNTGEIWVMILGPFLGLPLPLLPIHILWINLITDGLPGLALGVEPAESDTMRRPPRAPTESIFARGLWQHVALVGLLMGLIPLTLGWWAYTTGRPWQTIVFVSLALLQLGHAFAVRSERESFFQLGARTNAPLLATVAGTLALQLTLVYWAPAQDVFHTSALTGTELVLVLIASTTVFWAVELEKLVRRRRDSARTSHARP